MGGHLAWSITPSKVLEIPWWQVICWSVCISTMGALFAFPLKKRFINDEQLRFPEGYIARPSYTDRD